LPEVDVKGLNERQKQSVRYLTEHKKISRGEYAKLCGCSVRTAFNDLDEMVKRSILKRVGTTGKYTYYILKSNGQSK